MRRRRAFGSLEFFDRRGRPLSFEEWQRRFFSMKYRRVGLTVTRSGAEVSTVWLGLATGDDPPLIFETLISTGTGSRAFDKYATMAEARAGHARHVARRGGPA